MKPYRPIMNIDRIVPPELQRAGLLGKFVPSVEAQYKQWFLTPHLARHANDPLDLGLRVGNHAIRAAARAGS